MSGWDTFGGRVLEGEKAGTIVERVSLVCAVLSRVDSNPGCFLLRVGGVVISTCNTS